MSGNHWRWQERRARGAALVLEDGTVFDGYSIGAPLDRVGEVVFNTGMTGYQEILSDPSYSGQIVVMTYPEIGNTGTNADDMESDRMFANGFVVGEINRPSNWRNVESLDARLARCGIAAIAGVDTRALTARLRDKGTQKGMLSVTGAMDVAAAVRQARQWEGLDGQDYAARVTCARPYEWDPDNTLSLRWGGPDTCPPADMRVVVYDFGVKWNILRALRMSGMAVTVVPAHTPAEAVLKLRPDGVFLSNGPADPAALPYAVASARDLVGKVPLMGICLGLQILGLALGGRTYRLKYGHHGCNHPVKDLDTGKVEITSQNHNFAIDGESLDSSAAAITHVSLNDNTVEGFRHRQEPLFCVQYHPEACPGPRDASYLFDRFRSLIRTA